VGAERLGGMLVITGRFGRGGRRAASRPRRAPSAAPTGLPWEVSGRPGRGTSPSEAGAPPDRTRATSAMPIWLVIDRQSHADVPPEHDPGEDPVADATVASAGPDVVRQDGRSGAGAAGRRDLHRRDGIRYKSGDLAGAVW
jgi:hypothetical protein